MRIHNNSKTSAREELTELIVKDDKTLSLYPIGGEKILEVASVKHSTICQWMKTSLVVGHQCSICMTERKWDQESNLRQVEGAQLLKNRVMKTIT